MVFDVVGQSDFHTPTTPDGTHDWFAEYQSTPVTTEPGGEPPPCG